MQSFIDLDRRAYLLCLRRYRSSRLTPLMIGFTHSGTKGTLWLALSAAVFAFGGQHGRATALAALLALLLTEGLINLLLKPVFARERPYVRYGLRRILVAAPGAGSWPSAHAGSSMAAALVLAAGFPPLFPLFVGAALIVAYSRVYVGVHYPFDVLSGAIIGASGAFVVLMLWRLLLGGL